MKRILKFEGKTARWDVPSFLWTENEPLTIEFDIVEQRAGTHYASIRCGNRLNEVSLATSKMVEVPAQFIKDGDYSPLQISLEFRSDKGGAVIVPADPKRGGYFIEPLAIERVEESTTAIAMLQALEAQFKAKTEKLAEDINTLRTDVTRHEIRLDCVPDQIKNAVDEMGIHLVNGDPLKM
jgi:hypothetical protein